MIGELKSFKLLCINLLCFVIIGMMAAFLLVVIDDTPEIRNSSIITNIMGPRIPKEKDLTRLKADAEVLLLYLEEQDVVKDKIKEIYSRVDDAIVCSETNRNFNELEEQYVTYTKQLKEILKHIEAWEKDYNYYLQLMDNIPEYSRALRIQCQSEFDNVITPNYEKIRSEKERYINDQEEVEKLYTTAKKKADDLFEEYFHLMCCIVTNEAGALWAPSIERYYVANEIENRIKNPLFPNTIREVLFAPGQYAPETSSIYKREPFSWVKSEMEDYLRGRIETGMPDNVVYHALSKQGSGVWKEMSSGHYFCYL